MPGPYKNLEFVRYFGNLLANKQVDNEKLILVWVMPKVDRGNLTVDQATKIFEKRE